MNGWVLASGIFAALTTIGHFSAGRKMYVQPMLNAAFDPVAKKVMLCVFHYVSVFLLTTTAVLLLAGSRVSLGSSPGLLVRFIAVNYMGCAVWQLMIASTAGIPKGPLKPFQWIFFILIAVPVWIGGGTC